MSEETKGNEVDTSAAEAEVKQEAQAKIDAETQAAKIKDMEAKLAEYQKKEQEAADAAALEKAKSIEEQLKAKDDALKALEEKMDNQLKAIKTRQSIDANGPQGDDRKAAMDKLKANPEAAIGYYINEHLSPELKRNLPNPLE